MSAASPLPSRTLVIQPLPGIGDMIWHLPHIHALADAAPDRRVTILAKPRALADQLFKADPRVEAVLTVDLNPGQDRRGAHDGWLGLARLARVLRGERFARVFVLHPSWRHAAAGWAAGIPERRGYGGGRQGWFLAPAPRPPIIATGPEPAFHAIERADRFLATLGLAPKVAEIPLEETARRAVASRLAKFPGAPIGLVLGASEPRKQWGAAAFTTLATALLARGHPAIALIGGAAQREIAMAVARALDRDKVMEALDWPLQEAAALIEACRLVVGNDTGLVNLAPAVGTPALALCGATPRLAHSPLIEALGPPDGPDRDGMSRITPEAVLARLETVIKAGHRLEGSGDAIG